MTVKLKNEKNEEVEVMTPEELEKHIEDEKKKAVEEATKGFKDYGDLKKDLEDRDKELGQLKIDLEVAKEALEKEDRGTQDWADARKNMKTLESQIVNLTKEREEDKKKFAEDLRNVRTSTFKSSLNSWLDNLSNGDKEMREKLEFQYNRLGKDVEDEGEAMKIVKDAHLLVTGKQAPNMFNVARGFSGGEVAKVKEVASQEVAELGKKFGITDKDIATYGLKAAEKRQAN